MQLPAGDSLHGCTVTNWLNFYISSLVHPPLIPWSWHTTEHNCPQIWLTRVKFLSIAAMVMIALLNPMFLARYSKQTELHQTQGNTSTLATTLMKTPSYPIPTTLHILPPISWSLPPPILVALPWHIQALKAVIDIPPMISTIFSDEETRVIPKPWPSAYAVSEQLKFIAVS